MRFDIITVRTSATACYFCGCGGGESRVRVVGKPGNPKCGNRHDNTERLTGFLKMPVIKLEFLIFVRLFTFMRLITQIVSNIL